MTNRLDVRFAALKEEGRAGLVPFITAGDPNADLSAAILKRLPGAGADIIELGVPFSDPSADGPTIDRASQRAIAAGGGLRATLDMVTQFRRDDTTTPIVLMGYFNPLLAYGIERFTKDAVSAGVDGLIVVDLPPEEDEELRVPAENAGLHFVRLATPTSDAHRLERIVNSASGFIYYVAVAGITGQKTADDSDIEQAVARLKAATDLPVAVGFGIKSAEKAAAVAQVADAAVVGSAIVQIIEDGVADQTNEQDIADKVIAFVEDLSSGVKGAR